MVDQHGVELRIRTADEVEQVPVPPALRATVANV
jgi:hypothetical protein